MNKLKLKKLLTFLICLTLIASVLMLAACNKNDDNNGSSDDETKASPSFSNGNFASYTVPSTDNGYPYAPGNFSGSPTSDPAGLPSLDTITRGVIKLTDFDKFGTWCTFPAFSANRLDSGEDDDYDKDDAVLMINNSEPSYYMYRSDSFTVSANSKYLLQVDVRTAEIGGGAKRGATVKISKNYSSGYGIVPTEGYASFDSINADEWTTYSFVIVTRYNSSSSLELQLMLGNDAATEEYLSSGFAFFDNIRFEKIVENAEDENDNTVIPETNVQTVDLSVPNANFDYYTSSDYPFLYSKNVTDSNSNYGVINVNADKNESGNYKFGSYEIDASAIDEAHGNAYVLYNTQEAKISFYTNNTLYFVRGGKYKLSVDVNTKFVESGKAFISLGAVKDVADAKVIAEIGKNDEGWATYTFYVCANENLPSELYFQFGLGKDSDNKAKGYALFDNLRVTEATEEEIDGLPSDSPVFYDQRLKASDNAFTAEWNKGFDGDTIGEVKAQITAENFSDGDSLPYKSEIFTGNKKYSSSVSTLYKIRSDALTLDPYSYYRFSMWIKTEDVPEKSGVTLTVYDGDLSLNKDAKAVATYSSIITAKDLADSSSSLNGYRELVCYFHTSDEAQAVTFELSFGSGNRFTSNTLFSGTAYIANTSLVKTEYSKFNSASSSGTYEKKYDWYSSVSGSFKNGQFDSYNYTETKYFDEGGRKDGDSFINFGVPSNWKLKGETSHATAGIVDINRTALLSNLGINKSDVGIYDSVSDPLKYGNYAGGSSVLLVKSADIAGLATEQVRVGYVSDSFSLSANKYYRISVLVKVKSGEASVYLMTDNNLSETNASTKYENIKPEYTETATETNGWKRYTFLVKTGFSSINATLGLYLGGEEKSVELTTENTVEAAEGKYVYIDDKFVLFDSSKSEHTAEGVKRYDYSGTPAKGGAVMFDYVTMNEIEEDDYVSLSASAKAVAAGEHEPGSDYEVVKPVEMNVDGFGLSASHEVSNEDVYSPTGWTRTKVYNDDSEGLSSGVIIGSGDYKAFAGESCLIIPHLNSAGATYYTSSAKTLAKDGYYKISVFAKNAATQGNGYIKITATGYTDESKYVTGEQTQELLPADGDWHEYVFFIKAPSSTADTYKDNAKDLSLKIVLGFGEKGAENYAQGYALFDNVLVEKFDATAENFDQKVADFMTDNTYVSVSKVAYDAIDKEEESTPGTEPGEEDNSGDSKNYNWLIFTSVAFGAIIVIAVVVYFLRKYLPKRKANSDKKKTTKKEDKYKDLND